MILSAIILGISCTENKENNGPVKIVANPLKVNAAAGDYDLSFTVEDLGSHTLTAEASEDWITINSTSVSDGKVSLHVDNNFGSARLAKISFLVDGEENTTATISQEVFSSDYFNVSVTDVSSYGCTAKISTKETFKGNYYFIILDKTAVDEYFSLTTGSYGDMEYLNNLYEGEVEWLKKAASNASMSLADYLAKNRALYQIDGADTEMPYSTLSYNTEYYLAVFGMDIDTKRTTPVVLREFATKDIERADITFTATASNIKEHSAEVVVKPSNDNDMYYWTYISEIDYNKVGNNPRNVMNNMIANIKTASSTTGNAIATFLHKGASQENIADVWANTKFTVIAWGMDAQGSATTDPVEVMTFTTAKEPVTDNCKFTIAVTEVEEMDIKIKVIPSNNSTRYYIAPVLKSYTEGYNDDQFAQRIINMQNQQWEGTTITWENTEDLFTGIQEKWGRKDLTWTFQAAHDYVVYVFGVAIDGTRTTEVAKVEARTAEPKPSTMTFTTKPGEPDWHIVTCEVTPSNDQEGWLPFFIETSEIDNNGLRKADGTLENDAIMSQIEAYYEEMGENINYAIRYGKKTYSTTAYKSGVKYSLLLCAWNGVNTTGFTEVQFDVPEMPFEKGKAEFLSEPKLTVFNAKELAALDPVKFANYVDQDAAIILMETEPNASTAHWYMAFWPAYTNYNKEGGLDYMVRLMISINKGYSNCVIDESQMWSPYWTSWADKKEDTWTDPNGKVYKHEPQFFYSFAEDADGNFGKMHIQYFRPVATAADKQEDFDIVASKPYKFWENNDSKTVQTLYVLPANGQGVKRLQFN